jgi:hypothetical protein
MGPVLQATARCRANSQPCTAWAAPAWPVLRIRFSLRPALLSTAAELSHASALYARATASEANEDAFLRVVAELWSVCRSSSMLTLAYPQFIDFCAKPLAKFRSHERMSANLGCQSSAKSLASVASIILV